ncbi:HNH endonuclease signature motif containing protein [Mycobacterium camsae]|uniref:HNH endonuclease signature motif containing protein n=1 Tax=Mycobacterium gordonae TaxID=1778 RepID=UPI00197DA177|nr:HNH endonuclease signature motif containing protein [Mycobacterium gordonae]
MFDKLSEVDDTAVVDAMAAATRDEALAAARRFAAIAELVARRAVGATDQARWSCDNWDAIAAQVGAALNISHSLASHQMYQALALRTRLPAVGALFAQGRLSLRLVIAIIWHTELIKDPVVLRLVDAVLANDALSYGPMSQPKTARAIDAIIGRYDPAAVRRARSGARSREVVITASTDGSGTAQLWGTLLSTDAVILDRRLSEMAHQVCPADPRTLAQRRADALGVLAADGDQLACQCSDPDCPARIPDARAAAVVIHVVAESTTVCTPPDPHLNGEQPQRVDRENPLRPAPDPEPAGLSRPSAQILGGPVVPAAQLAALIAAGAKTAPIDCCPRPSPGYRPSAALARFIRARDMTCRFPGCDCPADACDIDHAIAYPFGPTHRTNLRCLCRKHHLLKTFWSGTRGWRDRQLPDATIIWTAPTGHTYTTRPGSRLCFPSLCGPTEPIPATSTPPADGPRGLMMPIRRRTRAQHRQARVNAERAQNLAHLSAPKFTLQAPRPLRPSESDEPPPF